MHPEITVCIPTYNYAHYLGAAITSVLEQSYPHFELLIVDDCSTDATDAVVAGFDDPRLRFVRNERNLGIVGNWNRCLELTRTPFVALLHADDLYLPQMLERSLAVLRAQPAVGYSYSAFYQIDAQGQRTWLEQPFPEDHVWPGEREFRHHLVRQYVQCPTVVLRRAVFEHVGLFVEHPLLLTAYDWEMWLRIQLAGYQVAYHAEPLACWRWHGGNKSNEVVAAGARVRENVGLVEYVLRRLPPAHVGLAALRRPAIYAAARRAFVQSWVALRKGDQASARAQWRQGLWAAGYAGLPLFVLHLLWRTGCRMTRTLAIAR
jgi:glycosyltransferase involved in cell wall biosynthesis